MSKEKKIDGCNVTCDPLRGRAAVRTWAKLCTKLGPAFAALGERLKGVSDMKSLSQMDVSALGAAVAAALSSLADPDDMVDIMQTLLSRTEVVRDGTKYDLSREADFDKLFEANTVLAFKLCAFSMEVNYGGFFDMFRALAASAGVRAGKS